MANKKVLVWVAIGSALLIGGGIFWWMKTRDKNKGDDKDVTNPDNKDVVTPPTPTPTPTPNTGGGGYTPSVANPFKTAQDVKDFQNWLDKNHPTWLNGGKLSQGGGYGNFGSRTQKAWNDYGVEYKTAITPAPKVAPFAKGDVVYLRPSAKSLWVYSYPEIGTYMVGEIKKSKVLANQIGTVVEYVAKHGYDAWVKITLSVDAYNVDGATIKSKKGTDVYVRATDISKTPY
jgi:hypothetical protein